MTLRVLRWAVIAICVVGIAGMIIGSIADNNNGVVVTFGLITAVSIIVLMAVATTARSLEAKQAASAVHDRDLDIAIRPGPCSDGDQAPRRHGRTHRVHGVHHQVQQHLLQLHRIARHQRQALGQHRIGMDFAADQLAVQQPERRLEQLHEIDPLVPDLAFLEQAAQAIDHLGGAIVLRHDVVEDVLDLGRIEGEVREQLTRKLAP